MAQEAAYAHVLCSRLTAQTTGVYDQLTQLKEVVAEPRQAGEAFDAAISTYYRAVQDGRGGLFMAVCRGKVGASTGRVLTGVWTSLHWDPAAQAA